MLVTELMGINDEESVVRQIVGVSVKSKGSHKL